MMPDFGEPLSFPMSSPAPTYTIDLTFKPGHLVGQCPAFEHVEKWELSGGFLILFSMGHDFGAMEVIPLAALVRWTSRKNQ